MMHRVRIIALLLVPHSIASGAVLHVPSDHATIQAASEAAMADDEIVVAAGRYPFALHQPAPHRLTITGAGPGRTVLDMEESAYCLDCAFHGVTLRATRPELRISSPRELVDCALRDFNGTTLIAAYDDLLLERTVIAASRASSSLIDCNGDLTVVSCWVQGNAAGGAIIEAYALEVSGSVITGNFSGTQAALTATELTLTSSTITANRSAETVGGIHVRRGATLHESIVVGNLGADDLPGDVLGDAVAEHLYGSCNMLDRDGILGDWEVHVGYVSGTDPRWRDAIPATSAPSAGGDFRVQAGSLVLPEENACGVLIGALGESPESSLRPVATATEDCEAGLTWEHADVATTGYEIRVQGVRVDSVSAETRSWVDSDAQAGSRYAYSVVPIRDGGPAIEHASDPVTEGVPPWHPQVLAIHGHWCNGIHLAWTASPTNEVYYRIHRDGELLASTLPDVTSFVDTAAVEGARHAYEITAVGACGESWPSVPARTWYEPPLAPESFRVGFEDETRRTWGFGWSSVFGAAGYEVRLAPACEDEGPARIDIAVTGTDTVVTFDEPPFGGAFDTWVVALLDPADHGCDEGPASTCVEVDDLTPIDPPVSDGSTPVARLTVSDPVPTPASRQVSIDLALPSAGPVDVTVLDVSGRRVRTLLHGWREIGHHRIVWDGRDEQDRPVAPGVYFLVTRAEGRRLVSRLVRGL